MTRIGSICIAGALLAGSAIATSEREFIARMETEHAADEPTPSGVALVAPNDEIQGQVVDYASVEGDVVSGYLARPAGARPGPGVIVIHEWWGLNENIRAMADRLAGDGFTALAVDLYGGEVAEDSETARNLAMGTVDRRSEVEENLRQAHAFLRGEGSEKIGVIGWCFGGGLSLRTALLLPDEIDATVIYYGRLVTERDELEPLESAILGIFGSLDRGIPVANVREFETALSELGKEASIHIYEGADHAFANPSGSRYKEEAAEDAWKKTVAFFTANLKE